jgi:hypothetical protein
MIINNTQSAKTLIADFLKIAESGDAQAAKAFLTAHVKEFPEEMQQKILLAFFEDALQKKADSVEVVSKLQKEAMSMMGNVTTAEKNIIDEKKIADVRSKLQ